MFCLISRRFPSLHMFTFAIFLSYSPRTQFKHIKANICTFKINYFRNISCYALLREIFGFGSIISLLSDPKQFLYAQESARHINFVAISHTLFRLPYHQFCHTTRHQSHHKLSKIRFENISNR